MGAEHFHQYTASDIMKLYTLDILSIYVSINILESNVPICKQYNNGRMKKDLILTVLRTHRTTTINLVPYVSFTFSVLYV